MPRKKILDPESDKLNGRFDVKSLYDALVEINQTQQIDVSTVKQMLEDSLLKAYKDWWCLKNGFPTTNSQDMLAQISVDWDKGDIHIYDCKKVQNEDDITDDFLEISLEEAQKDFPDIQVGDIYKKEIDYTKLDRAYIRRVVADFHQRMREVGKQILLDSYATKLGHNILGTVTRVDQANGVELDFGRATGTLSKREMLPTDVFATGEQVKVFLVGVGERDGRPSLIVSRTNEGYVKALFEEEVPEVADGTVKIAKIARQAGVRTKVMVSTTFPNIDPVGVLIGNDSVRYRAVLSELGRETVDVLNYPDDPALLPLEALKPAKIVGIAAPANPDDPLIAICLNNDKKVAVGRQGCNVRLAGRICVQEIKIMEVDEAINQHVSYVPATQIISEAQARLAKKKADEEALKAQPATPVAPAPVAAEADKPLEETKAPAAETAKVEMPAPAAAPAVVAASPVALEKAAVEAKPEPVKPIEVKPQPAPVKAAPAKPVAHITVAGTPKVSLSELEQEIERERQRKANAKPYFNKWHKEKPRETKKEIETEEERAKREAEKNAMPIYTPEELKEIEKEDQQKNDDGDYNFDDYDSDSFYDDDNHKRH